MLKHTYINVRHEYQLMPKGEHTEKRRDHLTKHRKETKQKNYHGYITVIRIFNYFVDQVRRSSCENPQRTEQRTKQRNTAAKATIELYREKLLYTFYAKERMYRTRAHKGDG